MMDILVSAYWEITVAVSAGLLTAGAIIYGAKTAASSVVEDRQQAKENKASAVQSGH